MASSEPESTLTQLAQRLAPRALFARGFQPTAPSPPLPPSPEPFGATPQALTATTASNAVEDAVESALDRLFPEFEIQERIGRGGGGTVYRVFHRQMRRYMALKILSGAHTRSAEAVARFEREIAAIGTLDDPRIVRAFNGGERQGVWFLTMELVDGIDLSTLSTLFGPLDPGDACEIIRQAALALQHAHERGLIHRDVKPGNFMVTLGKEGVLSVKVLDFGLAHLAETSSGAGALTITGDFLGTIDYVAPEQIVDPRDVDQRVDIYSLGATLFRLLAGHSPHPSASSGPTVVGRLMRIAQDPCPSIGTVRPDLPAGLVWAVDKMLSRERSARFDTAAQVVDALVPFAAPQRLLGWLATQNPATGPLPEPRPTVRSTSRTLSLPMRVGVYGAALVGVILATAFWVRQTGRLVAKVSPRLEQVQTVGDVPRLSRGTRPRGITRLPDGSLVGSTVFGGEYGHGILYVFRPPSGLKVVVNFTGTSGSAKGRMPGRQLVLGRDGFLYGVTERGGQWDCGTLFRYRPDTDQDAVQTVWEFRPQDGCDPLSGLIEDRTQDGVFYGGTLAGGAVDAGVLFQLTVNGGNPSYESLVEFTGNDGIAPGHRLVANLAQGADGALYGTTPEGGSADGGVAFRWRRGEGYRVLAAFGDGPTRISNPTSGLTPGDDGMLYGTCLRSADGRGAVFRIRPPGAVELVARFLLPNGGEPGSTLYRGLDGAFYGATLGGGTSDRGTVFRFSEEGGLLTLGSIGDVNGIVSADAWGMPVLGADGSLYGAVEQGGGGRGGFLYRLQPGGSLSVAVEFGDSPIAAR